jgi:hypothetical protein
MKKSDLKTGMWVELRNGKSAMVLMSTNNGDILSGPKAWFPIDALNDDLTYEGIKDSDIIRIYQPMSNRVYFGGMLEEMNLLWERKPAPIEMTLQEAIQKLEEVTGKPIKITI